ncbi:hypothetical protein ACHAQA_007735 [Verticillium albo-atrum]
MEIPKFRRKPKAPTIATDPKTLTVPDSADSSPTSNTIPLAISATTPGKQGSFRKSALRHLRSSAKRARSPAPPAPASSSPPPTLATTRDGLADTMPASPVSIRHRDGLLADSPERYRSKMPFFLDLPQDGINSKFQDLTWAERNRLHNAMAQEAATNPDSSYRYAVHKQVDMRRGMMDRYCNIKPYNRTRVRLRVPDGTLDYVNASTVELSSPRKGQTSALAPAPAPLRYIAMQGPVENSVDFVWRMVEEQFDSPVVIVQLTTMFENGSIKCFPYFPMSAEDEPWILNEDDGWEDGWRGELRFDSMETLEDGAIELRKLILRVDSVAAAAQKDDADAEPTQTASPAPEPTERVIWHFLYTRWPDFGTPAIEDLGSFLTLMRLSREYNTGSSTALPAGDADAAADAITTAAAGGSSSSGPPPRIIHCSAGVGRTGTFIALEHLMRELDAGLLESYPATNPDLIHTTVEALREQRPSMVQAPPQFLFLYSVLRRMWLERYAPAAVAAEGGSGSDDAMTMTTATTDDEPAAKRLEVGDPFVD